MKKLFPLLLFGVAILFFSCEKNEPTIAKVEFAQSNQTLSFENDLTLKVNMTRPAATDILIPFEVAGDAVEETDYEFTNVEDHHIRIPQGRLEGELTIKHLLHNGSELPLRIKLRSGEGYQLGDNAICVVTISQREKIYVSFDYAEYPTEEFSNVYIGITLTGEKSGENFRAPENIELGYKVIELTDASGVTNVTNDGWSWVGQNNSNNTVVIEKGSNKAGRILRVKYANTTLPDPIVEPEEGEDPVEPTVYKAGVTIRTTTAMANLGIEYKEGGIDTTYIIYNRMKNPIEDLLMGKKWVNPTLGFTQYFSNAALFRSYMTMTGDKEELLPSKSKVTDSFVFTKEKDAVTEEDLYKVVIDADPTSDFTNYFRSDTVWFEKYTNNNTPYLAGTGTGGFELNMKVNKSFSPFPAEEEIIKAPVFFVPGSISGTDNSYIDIFVLSGQYTRWEGRFFYAMATWRSIYGSRVGDRYFDVWYRIFEDKTPNP